MALGWPRPQLPFDAGDSGDTGGQAAAWPPFANLFCARDLDPGFTDGFEEEDEIEEDAGHTASSLSTRRVTSFTVVRISVRRPDLRIDGGQAPSWV